MSSKLPSSLNQYILEFLHPPFVNKVTTLAKDKPKNVYRDTTLFASVCRKWDTDTKKYYASRNNRYSTIFPTTHSISAMVYHRNISQLYDTFVPLSLDQVLQLSDRQLIDYVNRLGYLDKKEEIKNIFQNANILNRIKNWIPHLHLIGQRQLVWRALELADVELLSSLKTANIAAFWGEYSNLLLIKYLYKCPSIEEPIIKILDWYKNQPELLHHLSNGQVVIQSCPRNGKTFKLYSRGLLPLAMNRQWKKIIPYLLSLAKPDYLLGVDHILYTASILSPGRFEYIFRNYSPLQNRILSNIHLGPKKGANVLHFIAKYDNLPLLNWLSTNRILPAEMFQAKDANGLNVADYALQAGNMDCVAHLARLPDEHRSQPTGLVKAVALPINSP